jgi:hypothetical protein
VQSCTAGGTFGTCDCGGPADAGNVDAGNLDAGDVDAFVCPDFDGDGFTDIACGGSDCDDHESSRYPGATEVCDADDEDCDDTTYGADADGDGFESVACCNGSGNCGVDCDDAKSDVNPASTESCNGGIDDDCNGLADAADGVCVPCAAGYTGVDADCVDVDECATSDFCGTGSTGCVNRPGTFECVCESGYATASVSGALCQNVDECAGAANPCGTGTCTDNAGSYVCTCPAGYRLATSPVITCVEINECDVSGFCGTGSTACTNVPGTFACTCGPGYRAGSALGALCENLDECAAGTNPCGTGTCTDSSGSYSCACPAGYVAPATAGTCEDRNECATSGICGAGSTGCANLVGTFSCACSAGYRAPSAFGAPCENVDECAASGFCGMGSTGCADLPGSFSCSCAAGYRTASPVGALCENINECADGSNPCGAGACTDTAGGYACTCPAGYRLAVWPTISCIDVNECADGIATCTQVPFATCENTVGTFLCHCPAGYEGSGRGAGGCVDVDECARGADDCEASVGICSNNAGGYSCACPPGFVGTGHGAGGCQWTDPSLTGLAFGAGTSVSPAFAPATTIYTVTLPPGALATTLTPTVAQPLHTTITASGSAVESGVPVAENLPSASFAPRVVNLVVTTETGATRSYTVVFVRGATYVKQSNTGANDAFGAAVSLSADGMRLAVGASSEASNATGVNGNQSNDSTSRSGAVYVFARTGAIWAQEAYVKASNPDVLDSFGAALSLSADGTRLAVGATYEDSGATGINGNQADNGVTSSGAVYVFARTGTSWAQEAYVKASNPSASDEFGYWTSLSSDGTRLAVGAHFEGSSATGVGGSQANEGAPRSGAAYVFSRSGTTWVQEAYVKASNTNTDDFFGWAGALSADGTRLAVGAPGEESNATGIGGNQANNSFLAGSGAVYVFSRSGTAWTQEAYVKPSNTGDGDWFGSAVSLSSDGSRLAVGARYESSRATGVGGSEVDNTMLASGAAYVFSRSGTAWTQEAYVKASNTEAGDWFGASVSLSADGAQLVVEAHYEDSSATGIGGVQSDNSAAGSGSAYVFARVGTAWTQTAYVKASNTEANDFFGWSVSLSGDGTTLAVGATQEDSIATGVGGDQTDNNASSGGAVYLY